MRTTRVLFGGTAILIGIVLIVAGGIQRLSAASEARVKPLLLKELPDIPGKEMVALEVEYPPAGTDPVHRHNAHGFVYVLEGSIVMGVRGGKEVTLGPGQMFYEGPDDIHTVGRSASRKRGAKFLVFLLKDKDAPVLVPAQ